MARPQPLANSASARSTTSDYRALTPRTPHSRSGRAEEGYTEFERQQQSELDGGDVHRAQHQTVPLLSSSASESFPTTGYRSHGDDHDLTSKGTETRRILQVDKIWSRIPLILGSLLAFFLLFLIFLSYAQPEKLHGYLGILQANNATATPETSHHNTSSSADSSLVISYENYSTFPLRPLEYAAECRKLNKGFMSHGRYWDTPAMGVKDVIHRDGNDSKVCNSTITYMLSGSVGLLADLALLAQVMSFAQEKEKTFFVDDTYWNRGKWADHFLDIREALPGPQPGCKPPPPEELVACPRLARHWVVNSHTAKFHLGHSFSEEYDDPYGHQLNRLKIQFYTTEDAFFKKIKPNKENAALIQRARKEFSALKSPDGTPFESYIALHLRRGDRKPHFYHAPYVPADVFVQTVAQTWNRLDPGVSTDKLSLFVASDSKAAHREVMDLTASRYTTYSLFQSADPELRALASSEEYVQKDFNRWEESARIRATRGMIVDFALIGGFWSNATDASPEAVICTFSSNVCSMAAVGLGWDQAFGIVDIMGSVDHKHKRWVDVDLNGSVVPAWRPFELF